MRQSLHLLWILGPVVACLAACSGEAGESDGDSDTPSAGTSGQTPPAGNAGTQPVGPTAGNSSGGASSAGSGNPAGGNAAAGTPATGGVPPVAGNGNAGAAGGPAQKPIPDFKFPTPSGSTQNISSSREVDDFDGNMARFVGSGDLGTGGDGEGQDPLFIISAGGSLKNVIIGAPAADGVHCEGSCTIENVWWEDVGEDAITLDGNSSSNVYRITGCGARKAADKVIQHNGAGTVYVKNFLAEDFSKLYRSCGNCGDQHERHSEFDTIVANGTNANNGVLAGINQNYGDTAKFVNVFADITMKICERYVGNDSGDEPVSQGAGADGTYCIYTPADVAWH